MLVAASIRLRRSALLPFAALVVLGGTTTGCLAPEETDAPLLTRVPPGGVGESSDAIQGGYPDATDSAVVGIVDIQGGLCSGSLIAPNLVLTARHCVSTTYDDDSGVLCSLTRFGTPRGPSSFYVTTAPAMTQNPSDYRGVVEVVTLPVADDMFCGQDMAMLILAENVPPEEATPYVPRVDSVLVAGEEYYAVGYGATSEAQNGAGQRRRRDSLFVECAEEGCGQAGYIRVTEWIGDTGICSGDSGGPAIDLLNRVVGVTSRGAYNCDDPVYGSTHGWGQWIKDTAARAATMGGYPPATWVTGTPTDPAYNHPVGAACTDGTVCPSTICWNGYCTRSCGESGPCPEGYNCEAPPEAGGGSLCVLPPEPTPEEPEEEEEEEDSAGSGGKKKGSDDGAQPAEGGCAIGSSLVREKDPVTPVPWLVGTAAVLLGLARRRRARG